MIVTQANMELTDHKRAPIINPSVQTHLYGFDYLRVFFMSMVVLGHSEVFLQFGASCGKNINFWDYAWFEVQSTAVPAFVLISSMLFVMKPPDKRRILDRLAKLGYLYVFWVSAWVIYSKEKPDLNALSVLEFLLRGGGWHFYTFSVLIVLTPVSWIAYNLPGRAKWLGLIASVAIVYITFVWVRTGFKWVYHPYYWLPTCFIIMPFVAAILTPKLSIFLTSRKRCILWAVILLFAGIIAAFHEWSFAAPVSMNLDGRQWLPKAARLSIQFTAIAMVCLSFIRKKPPGIIIAFLAKNSLGVYCIHGFFLRYFSLISVKLVGGPSPLSSCICAATLVVFSAFTTEFLRKLFRERLV